MYGLQGKMIEVYDNLLSQDEQDHIENFLRDPKFPWFLSIGHNHYTTSEFDIAKNSNQFSQECVLLTHVFYINFEKHSINAHVSDFVLSRFIGRSSCKFKSLKRSKANLQLVSKTSEKLYTTPHVDDIEDHTVLIYYVNDSDGDTFIFNNHKTNDIAERISHKKGRFVKFNGSLHHAAGLNKESDFRINLNYNLS